MASCCIYLANPESPVPLVNLGTPRRVTFDLRHDIQTLIAEFGDLPKDKAEAIEALRRTGEEYSISIHQDTFRGKPADLRATTLTWVLS